MIFRATHPPITIPHVPLSEFVLARAGERGDKPALIDGSTGRTVTYAQLAALVPRAAAGLAARGCRKGDVCAIFSPNLLEYAIAFHAAGRIGAITTPVYPLFTPAELARQLNEAGAQYIFTAPPLLPIVQAALAATSVREIFVFGASADGATSFDVLLDNEDPPPTVEIDPMNDLAALPFSSGTSGLPKGVMLTHYNLVSSLCQLHAVGAIKEADRLICVVPCAHLYGLHVIVNWSLYEGATVVLMPRFEPAQFLQLLQDYRITRAPLVPPLIRLLARHPAVAQFDLSHLKHVHSGGAPLSAADALACAARLDCDVGYAYGQTESSPLSHISAASAAPQAQGVAGYPLPNTECRIVDSETGIELGPHERGEVRTRGPQVMRGYLNRPQATAEAFDEEGWLCTGDIGYVDGAGQLSIVDRLKELIKYNGLQVAPAELEAVLLTHPAVADAAVIPSPDAAAGEVPKAFVVLQGAATAAELIAYVAARLASQKKVRRIEFIAEIPRSPSGKILRRILVERERANMPA